MNKYVINEFLTLKLEVDKINIYVGNVLFNQCQSLLLHISLDDTSQVDDIESIDEVVDILEWSEEEQMMDGVAIDPETEFWGHCSNLQAWYEHGYDTRLLHSNLAFPLLKKLMDVGDPLAKKMFKEEVARRFESGYPAVIGYLYEQNFFHVLTDEEKTTLIKANFTSLLEALKFYSYIPKSDLFLNIFKELKLLGILSEEKFGDILGAIDTLDGKKKYGLISALIYELPTSLVIRNRLGEILERLCDLHDSGKFDLFLAFMRICSNHHFLEEKLDLFLEFIRKINYKKEYFFYKILGTLQYYGFIEKNFTSILNSINTNFTFLEMYDRFSAFSFLASYFRDFNTNPEAASLFQTHFLTLLSDINKLPNPKKNRAYFKLIRAAEKSGLSKTLTAPLLEQLKKMPKIIDIGTWELLLNAVPADRVFPMNFFIDFLYTIPEHKKIYAFQSLLDTIKEPVFFRLHYLNFIQFINTLNSNLKIKGCHLLITFLEQIVAHYRDSGKDLRYEFEQMYAADLFPILLKVNIEAPTFASALAFCKMIEILNNVDLLEIVKKAYDSQILKSCTQMLNLIAKNTPKLMLQFDTIVKSNSTLNQPYLCLSLGPDANEVSVHGNYSILRIIHRFIIPLTS